MFVGGILCVSVQIDLRSDYSSSYIARQLQLIQPAAIGVAVDMMQAQRVMMQSGFLNTYMLSKNLTEKMVMLRDGKPNNIVIVRPSLIGAVAGQPCPVEPAHALPMCTSPTWLAPRCFVHAILVSVTFVTIQAALMCLGMPHMCGMTSLYGHMHACDKAIALVWENHSHALYLKAC